MKVIIFDLYGKMAHFRKFYTNSSSLSYYFPPRTTIIGLIAGLLGYERDSYYEIFSPENTKITLSIKSPLRKVMQMINYVWAENIKQLNLSKGQHTQVPFEIIFPQNIKENIYYRIFFHHKNEEILEDLKNKIKTYTFCFPPYLGITEFVGNIEFVGEGKAVINRENQIILDSIISVDYIKHRSIYLETYLGAQYVKEKMPFSFNKYRLLKDPPKEYIGEIKTSKISLKGEVEYYKVSMDKSVYNVVFMED
ncbi:MAG: type I-B CRISPR-associated protein Cas5b [Dictyoglomaceae bacterium]|nr:type I-B CRISPR-associated protein Cas5b [Dictyoglomaceae bacterium]